MAKTRIYICVQGLFTKGDSIGFDAVFQWRLLTAMLGGDAEIRIFCERARVDLHPGIPIESIPQFDAAIAAHRDAIVVYHFCDGWPALEDKLIAGCDRLIVRWHNNTPPWFLAPYTIKDVGRTVRGFDSILRLARETRCRFWCNSDFTMRQLETLGEPRSRADIVYPASRYIELPTARERPAAAPSTPTKILFVSRIAAHKGHRHIIASAAYAQQFLGLPVQISFPGRMGGSMHRYHDALRMLASALAVDMRLPGEADPPQLEEAYRAADVFLCLSEHEGFGLPVFEAMRVGLPVIAWTATATAELMSGHPLASAELSPRRIAAAIATSQIPEIRDYVVRWQRENVLARYSKDVIAGQIGDALRPFGVSTHNAGQRPTIDRFSDSRLDQEIAERIAAFERQIGDREIAGISSIPREIAGNFVTLHDIESYRSLYEARSSAPWLRRLFTRRTRH